MGKQGQVGVYPRSVDRRCQELLPRRDMVAGCITDHSMSAFCNVGVTGRNKEPLCCSAFDASWPIKLMPLPLQTPNHQLVDMCPPHLRMALNMPVTLTCYPHHTPYMQPGPRHCPALGYPNPFGHSPSVLTISHRVPAVLQGQAFCIASSSLPPTCNLDNHCEACGHSTAMRTKLEALGLNLVTH